MKTMLIEWPELNITVEAELEDVRNKELIDEIWSNLPMSAIQEHAMVTGKSMYAWVPMISLADIPFQMEIRDTPPGVVSYSQKTGNKMIVRYGKVTEDLLTPIVGFVRDSEQIKLLDIVGEKVWNEYKATKKPIIVNYRRGREA